MHSRSSIDLSSFNKLVGGIYDAAIDTTKWSIFMHQLTDTLNAKSCLLRVQHLRSKEVGTWISHGMDSSFQPSYREHFVNVDPVVSLLETLPVGQMIQTASAIPQAEFRATEYYNGYIKPQGMEHLAGGFLSKNNSQVAGFGIHRTARSGSYSKQEMEALRILVPHMQRVIEINRHLFQLEDRTSASGDVLERLPTAIVFTDRLGNPVFVNRRAQQLTLKENGLQVESDQLIANTPKNTSALHKLIFEAARPEAGQGGSLVIKNNIATKSLSVMVTPTNHNNGFDLGLDSSHIAAAIFIARADQNYVFPKEILNGLYGLTPREAHLAEVLTNGYSLEAAAEKLGISKNTARNHLKSCFQKTRVKRQAELTKLIRSSIPVLETEESSLPGIND